MKVSVWNTGCSVFVPGSCASQCNAVIIPPMCGGNTLIHWQCDTFTCWAEFNLSLINLKTEHPVVLNMEHYRYKLNNVKINLFLEHVHI